LRARVGAPFALALPLLIGSGITVGWLYEVYAGFGLLLLGMILLEISSALSSRFGLKADLAARAAVSFVLGGAALWLTTHPFLMSSVLRATTPARSGVSYCTATEHALVEAYIRRAANGSRPVVVQFLPDADSLLFTGVRSPSIRLLQQTFFSTRPDVYILHDSPWFPQFLRDIELADFAMRNRVDLPLGSWGVIAKTTIGARWVAVQHDGAGLPWY